MKSSEYLIFYLKIFVCRFRELQLTASKNAIFSRESFEALGYVPRTVTPINQVPDASPLYDEFDTVGIVSFIGPAPYVCF